MTATITFMVLLPCSVWLLGSLLGLLDGADAAAALRRVAWRGLPFVAAALLLGRNAAWPALAAVAAALTLNAVVPGVLRTAVRRGLTRASTATWDD